MYSKIFLKSISPSLNLLASPGSPVRNDTLLCFVILQVTCAAWVKDFCLFVLLLFFLLQYLQAPVFLLCFYLRAGFCFVFFSLCLSYLILVLFWIYLDGRKYGFLKFYLVFVTYFTTFVHLSGFRHQTVGQGILQAVPNQIPPPPRRQDRPTTVLASVWSCRQKTSTTHRVFAHFVVRFSNQFVLCQVVTKSSALPTLRNSKSTVLWQASRTTQPPIAPVYCAPAADERRPFRCNLDVGVKAVRGSETAEMLLDHTWYATASTCCCCMMYTLPAECDIVCLPTCPTACLSVCM